MLYLTLTENLFQFCSSNCLQTHGTAMRTKVAVAFENTTMQQKLFATKASSRVTHSAWRKALLRGSVHESKDLFLSNHFWEKYQTFRKSPCKRRLPRRNFEKVPHWGKICWQENSPLEETKPPGKKHSRKKTIFLHNTTQLYLVWRKY